MPRGWNQGFSNFFDPGKWEGIESVRDGNEPIGPISRKTKEQQKKNLQWKLPKVCHPMKIVRFVATARSVCQHSAPLFPLWLLLLWKKLQYTLSMVPQPSRQTHWADCF